jgi:hypothetical protein
MKLDEIRKSLDDYCTQAVEYIASIGPVGTGIRGELFHSFLDATISPQAMRNQLGSCGFTEEEMLDLGNIINHIEIEWKHLQRAEREALHSLQQEASLVSTRPKSSLDH